MKTPLRACDKARIKKKISKEIFALSSVTNKGLEEILNKVLNVIKKNEKVEKETKWSP